MLKLKIGAILIFAFILTNPISFLHNMNIYAQTSGSFPEYTEEGVASWYGPGFHGRKTASGERFNTNELTAAHKTLPFNTLLKVTNLENGKTTIVRVNDRGPYAHGRIIDLSFAAKNELQMGGLAKVKIELYEAPPESEQEVSSPSQPYNLFEDVFPAGSRILIEMKKSGKDLNHLNIQKLINTLKRMQIKVVAAQEEDAEILSDATNDSRSNIGFLDITKKIKDLKGFTLEILNSDGFDSIDELIGNLESANLDTVFIVEIVEKDSTNFKILVGNYKKESDSYNDRDKLEKMNLNVRLVKI